MLKLFPTSLYQIFSIMQELLLKIYSGFAFAVADSEILSIFAPTAPNLRTMFS